MQFSRISENVTANWTFCVQQFFFSAKVAIVNTKSATIDFSLLLVSSSSLFLLLLSFSFVRVILEQIGLKKPAAWRLSIQMTANFLWLV